MGRSRATTTAAFTALSVGLLLLAGCTSSPADPASSSSGSNPASSTTSSGASSTTAPTSSSASSSSAATSTAGSSTTSPSSGTATTATTAITVPAELTPVLARVSTEPVPVTGTDGATYLAYELYLTNATSSPVTIDSVQAVDSSSGAVLQDRSGNDLVAHSRVVGIDPNTGPASSVVLQGGQLAIVWLDPSVEGGAAPPAALHHRVTASFATAPNPLIGTDVSEDPVARTSVSRRSAPVISSPLSGRNWLDGNGCCADVTAHRGAANPIDGQHTFAERFAIDWVQLTDGLALTTGDPTQLSSYPYYGAPIHAVADGTIVAVSDELQDQVPGANPPVGSLTLEQYGGNHVVESFEQDGRTYYAFYAHLKPGSAKSRLQVGQQVQAGEQVGELGNSGNTDSPHLHFHVMDGPYPLASEGLPFALDEQELVDHGADASAIDALFGGSALPLAPDSPSGRRQEEMPLFLDVADLTPADPGTAATTSTSG